ncbi:ATP-binding protein [Weissella sp. GP1]|uniref:AAA family ATPase n=1 Tax=Weissella confusa TaxID=1583 RepID=UPI0032DA4651
MTKELKFLKIEITGHPLLMDGTELSMVADQRVMNDKHDKLTKLFGSVWVNNLTTIVGRNATGKTTLMKLTVGVLTLLLHKQSINQTRLHGMLVGNNPISFRVYFYGADNKVYLDEITLAQTPENKRDWFVKEERIFVKNATKNLSRKNLFDFSTVEPIIDRATMAKELLIVLANDDSLFRMIIAQEEYQSQMIVDTLTFTNVNMLVYDGPEVPAELLEYLDPSVEYLKISTVENGPSVYKLKFKGMDTEIVDNNFATIEMYLSSGTAKGVTLYQYVLRALATGGIIFIDELENHFNHAIVRSFIEYFTDPDVNKNRATLIFSTHYSEILDELDRGDQIYIALRNDQMQLIRYSDTGMREDISKTEVFDADNLNGTSPDYWAYMALRKATAKVVADAQR